MPRHLTEELQLFISVFLILVRMWPGTVTQNFSKSAWEKGCTFINVFTLVTYAAALVKVCFYLILEILLLIEKLSHKLGKCSITGLTKIDFTPAIGHHWQVRVSSHSSCKWNQQFKGSGNTHSAGRKKNAAQRRRIRLPFPTWNLPSTFHWQMTLYIWDLIPHMLA